MPRAPDAELNTVAHPVPDRRAAWHLHVLGWLDGREARAATLPPATEHDRERGHVVQGLAKQSSRAVQPWLRTQPPSHLLECAWCRTFGQTCAN